MGCELLCSHLAHELTVKNNCIFAVGITRITSVVDWGFITNYIYPGTVGAIGELQIDLWCYEGTSREMKFKDLNALTVSKFCHDAKGT